ncbi:hypothetical protein ACTNET_09410, partial [Lactobacillus amylovorus]|uniref:hypothetical protein n=2 Tax=Lactobacillus amylovorus TaxID=1604 RepID=UPI003F88D223
SQKTIAGKSSPYLSKLVFWLAQANEPLSPRLQSRVVDDGKRSYAQIKLGRKYVMLNTKYVKFI